MKKHTLVSVKLPPKGRIMMMLPVSNVKGTDVLKKNVEAIRPDVTNLSATEMARRIAAGDLSSRVNPRTLWENLVQLSEWASSLKI